jgi:hypothetical protein
VIKTPRRIVKKPKQIGTAMATETSMWTPSFILNLVTLAVTLIGFYIVYAQQRVLQKHAKQIDQCLIVTAAVNQSTRSFEKLKLKRIEQSKDVFSIEDMAGSGKERDVAQSSLEALSDLAASSQVIFERPVREKLSGIKIASDNLLSEMFDTILVGAETIDLKPLRNKVDEFTNECMKIADNY